MMKARSAGGLAMGAARPLGGAARYAADAAGQAACVAQVAVHELGELVLDDQRLRNDLCWSVFERP